MFSLITSDDLSLIVSFMLNILDANIYTDSLYPLGIKNKEDSKCLSLTTGIIIYYELWIRGTNFNDLGQRDVPETRLFHPAGQYSPRPFTPGIPPDTTLPPPVSNFLVTNLLPYHVYEFQVFSENSMGKVSSGWASGQTQPAGKLSKKSSMF